MLKLQKLNVLILEDNPDHTELIEDALSNTDECFVVTSCSSPKDFFRILRKAAYHALLIDYHLNNADGLEILKKLQSLEIDTPVIMISGTDDEETVQKCLEAGAADYMVKSRKTLQTLPITLKRSIIRKMSFSREKKSPQRRRKFLARRLEVQFRRITLTSLKASRKLRRRGLQALDREEIKQLENLLERTTDLLKTAKNQLGRKPAAGVFKSEDELQTEGKGPNAQRKTQKKMPGNLPDAFKNLSHPPAQS